MPFFSHLTDDHVGGPLTDSKAVDILPRSSGVTLKAGIASLFPLPEPPSPPQTIFFLHQSMMLRPRGVSSARDAN